MSAERERIAELAKRRGFFFPANEPYGGTAGFYVYGPQGAALKRNVEEAWRERFTVEEGNVEIDAPTIMPESVFEASGHLQGFDDLLVECPECGESHRADHLVEDETDIEDAEAFSPEEIADLLAEAEIECPNCGTPLVGQPVEEFNLMFETAIGPGSGAPGYLRPETAQGIFVEFPRLKEYARGQLPFGVTQIGTAYRNEISPRNALVRVREFTQAELELFIDPERDEPDLTNVADVTLPLYAAPDQDDPDGSVVEMSVQKAVESGVLSNGWIAYYLGIAREWYERIGVDMARFRFRQHRPGERAHYAADCWDAEAEVGGKWIEIAGFADRGDYDLRRHGEHADEDYTVFEPYDEPQTVERATVDPDMSYLGPELGAAAADVASALERLAATDREAFDGETVTVDSDGDTYELPTAVTGFSVEEVTERGEHRIPHVIEPSFGVGRTVYTLIAHAYATDEVAGESRTRLAFADDVAPTFVGVFPLMDRDGLGDRAHEVARTLRRAGLSVTYDDAGSIGRRYRRQDEVGTPYCVTVDYETLETDTVTIRDRDTATQRRVPIDDLAGTLAALRAGEAQFSEIGAAVADA